MTHGILGSKRNWRTPANLLAKTQPGIKVLTVDHRGHGNSHGAFLTDRNHTVDACAMDLEETILSDMEEGGGDVDILSGHSHMYSFAHLRFDVCKSASSSVGFGAAWSRSPPPRLAAPLSL